MDAPQAAAAPLAAAPPPVWEGDKGNASAAYPPPAAAPPPVWEGDKGNGSAAYPPPAAAPPPVWEGDKGNGSAAYPPPYGYPPQTTPNPAYQPAGYPPQPYASAPPAGAYYGAQQVPQVYITTVDPLPCGIGIQLLLFIFGFLFPFAWWVGFGMWFCSRRDPRERCGWIANTIMSFVWTALIVTLIALAASGTWAANGCGYCDPWGYCYSC